MVITSKNEPKAIRFRSTQIQYALTYVITTFLVLLILNIYSSNVSQKLFYNSKEASMIEKCQLAATEIAALDVVNPTTVQNAISDIGSLRATRIIVTDRFGLAIFDTAKENPDTGNYTMFPEIVQALKSFDVFSWRYRDGTMQSKAAVPIVSYGTLIGAVYIMEYDIQQGALIQTLQNTTLTITFILELLVIALSLTFSKAFTRRLRRIMESMRIIRSGDYTHKVTMGGNDELTILGNEFNDLVERLQVSEEKRSQFVSDASHELKTPLASIKLLSDSILQNDMDIETIREFVSDIGDEADRLNRMSQKLLTLSHIESQQDSDCEITYIGPTVERVLRMVTVIAQNNNITIHTDLRDDCPILILEDDLYQILFNLIENGIKYNTPGGSLTITVHRQEDNAVVRISDTGVGIPREALSNIFERFFRVDKARSRKSGGTGLGLSIVRSMVERNGGTICVDSTVGTGSTFTLTIPIFDTEESL